MSEDGLNVTLDIPKSRRHPVFHVGKLKKAKTPLNDVVSSSVQSDVRRKRDHGIATHPETRTVQEVDTNPCDSDNNGLMIVTDSSLEFDGSVVDLEQTESDVIDEVNELSEPIIRE